VGGRHPDCLGATPTTGGWSLQRSYPLIIPVQSPFFLSARPLSSAARGRHPSSTPSGTSSLTWHLRRAWAPLTFSDEAPPERADPVAPATRSPAASATAAWRAQPDGTVLRPFQGLLDHLATLTRNTNKVAGSEVTFDQLTEPTPTQRRAFELLGIPIPLSIM
jgi:hypothetical protein